MKLCSPKPGIVSKVGSLKPNRAMKSGTVEFRGPLEDGPVEAGNAEKAAGSEYSMANYAVPEVEVIQRGTCEVDAHARPERLASRHISVTIDCDAVGAGNLLWFMSEMKGQNSLGSDTNVPVTKSLTQ